eukprot:TRINITY_DN3631_c0_g1_i2.p1 TRINITY_DN3631_c0_g1~~TRINITY_DN3631_c0_g1_i2.p1  ORF type:complete len:191 (+),score=52.98 TRINITY_DN3631_c0_g1_i2:888-1460(+)
MVIEEKVVRKHNFHPLNVVGMEGLFGSLIMSLIVLPILYFVPPSVSFFHDDSIDALVQIGNSMFLLAFCLVYIFSISFYNFFGISVAKKLSSVHRTLIDACRTVLVWVTNLMIYYWFSHGKYGEKWVNYSSCLQLSGFIVLVLGSFTYSASIKYPFFNYTETQYLNIKEEKSKIELELSKDIQQQDNKNN